MGAEVIIPLAMAAVSAGAQYYDNRQQVKRADRATLASMQEAKTRQRRADERTQQLTDELAASTPDEERQGALQGYMDQLRRAQPDAVSGVRDISGASDAYRRDSADAALGIAGQGQRYADLASRLEAPAMQRQREGRVFADAGNDLGLIGREQEGADRTHKLTLQGIRSNPWLQALSTVAGGAASAYSGGAGGGGSGFNGAAQTSPISGVTVSGGGTGWQGDSAFGPWGSLWDRRGP